MGEDEKDGGRRADAKGANSNSPERSASDPAAPTRKRHPATEVGQALRSAYQRTLSEDIPPEMLDLLGKLG